MQLWNTLRIHDYRAFLFQVTSLCTHRHWIQIYNYSYQNKKSRYLLRFFLFLQTQGKIYCSFFPNYTYKIRTCLNLSGVIESAWNEQKPSRCNRSSNPDWSGRRFLLFTKQFQSEISFSLTGFRNNTISNRKSDRIAQRFCFALRRSNDGRTSRS